MTQNHFKKVAVLYGGLSSEREVSLRSGKAVAQALKNKNYEVIEIDVGTNIALELNKHQPDVAYIALHGKYGEDGAIQGLLELMQIPYTGSGVLSSALCMDKSLTKKILLERAFLSPAYLAIDLKQKSVQQILEEVQLSFPLIIKPATEGSTIGIRKVSKKEELPEAIKFASQYGTQLLLEEYIQGTEVTSGLIGQEALPLIEVCPKSGFYDFESKYTKGATEYILPARLPEDLQIKIQQTTQQIALELGCEGCVRADYIVDKNLRPYFLEINTIPGMTETSLIPKAAAHIGINFENLVEKILVSARLKLK